MLKRKHIRITLFLLIHLLYARNSFLSHFIKVRMLHTLFSCRAQVVIVLHHFCQQVQRIGSGQVFVVLIDKG
jgi:hypothetical protein